MKGRYTLSREDFREQLVLKYKHYIMDENVLGCLGDGATSKDYVLCNGDSDLLPILVKKNETRFEYNQYKYTWSYVSCTIFAAIGMLSDLIDYQFSYEQIKEADDLSYENPDYTPMRKRGEGWYVKLAVELVADRYNNSELSDIYGKVAFYRISKYDDDIVEDVLKKLYTIDGNYCPTKEYNEDKSDGMVDGTDFGANTNGHSVDVVRNKGQRSVKDSGSTKNNIYGLKNKLSKISNYGTYFYVYVLVNDKLEEVKRLNKMKTECINCIESLGKIRNLTNEKNFREILHYTANKLRDKIKTCNEMLVELGE